MNNPLSKLVGYTIDATFSKVSSNELRTFVIAHKGNLFYIFEESQNKIKPHHHFTNNGPMCKVPAQVQDYATNKLVSWVNENIKEN